MWSALFGLGAARRRALKRAPPGPMRDFLAASLPAPTAPCGQAPIAALDFEVTGTDPADAVILSMGLVEIRHRVIRLDTAWQRLLRPEQAIPEASAIIHQITDDQAAAGIALEEAVPQLLERLAGKVMLVHSRHIEQGFLDRACRELYGAPFLIPTIDTLELARRYLSIRSHGIQTGDLRLFNLRPRFNLPRYKAHNALNDALATAELFLAISAEMDPPGRAALKHFLAP